MTNENLEPKKEDHIEETQESKLQSEDEKTKINKSETVSSNDNNDSDNSNTEINLQVNKEALEEQTNTFNSLSKEVEDFDVNVNSIDEVKSKRKNLVELKEKILVLFLIQTSEKDELIQRIQDKFNTLKEKSLTLKDEVKAELEENYNNFRPRIEETFKTVQEAKNFKEIRNTLINFQNELKNIDLLKSVKDELFEKIQSSFEDLNKKQEEERVKYEMETSENYLKLRPEILMACKNALEMEKFNDARKLLIEKQKKIKEYSLKKDHLDDLFGKIREVFDTINSRQDALREKFKETADEDYNKIKPEVESAIEFAKKTDNPIDAKEKLIHAQKMIKDCTLTKKQRDELYGSIREVFNNLNDKLSEHNEEFKAECQGNFDSLEIKVNEAVAFVDFTENLKEIREALLEVQDEVKILNLLRNQRKELFRRIRLGFEKYDKKKDNYIQKRKSDKKEKIEKLIENKTQQLETIKSASNIEDEINKSVHNEEIEKINQRILSLKKELEDLKNED